MSSTVPPYLTLDEQIRYLYERDYFPTGSINEVHRERLAYLNFHYFLGYARNYRMIANNSLTDNPHKHPDRVFEIIDRDEAVSTLLYENFRRAEWKLRALAVKHYCRSFPPAVSFLQVAQYLPVSVDSRENLVRSICEQALRTNEPFVNEELKLAAARTGIEQPRRLSDLSNGSEAISLLRDVPLWAVVDGFTLGTLSRFITQCDRRDEKEVQVWRCIAKDLEVPAQVFCSNLESLVVLRNTVAHNARLWMKPTTSSPRPPKYFKKKLRDSHDKSMRTGFANLAMFLGRSGRDEFMAEIDALISADPEYLYGVTKIHSYEDANRAPSTPR